MREHEHPSAVLPWPNSSTIPWKSGKTSSDPALLSCLNMPLSVGMFRIK